MKLKRIKIIGMFKLILFPTSASVSTSTGPMPDFIKSSGDENAPPLRIISLDAYEI